jgi:hypothetical protein
MIVDLGANPISSGKGGDLGQVVGEDSVARPGFRSFEAVQAGAVPAVASFEVADPAFASGSPFDRSAECPAVLDLVPGGTRSAFTRDHDMADAEASQCLFDSGLAVSAISGHGAGCLTGPVFDPLDRRSQLWCIGRVSGVYIVIEDDTVVVVDDLRLVAELDWFTELAFRDRPGLLVVQTDHPAGSVRGAPGDPLPGLFDDPRGRCQQVRQVVDGAGQPATPSPAAGSRTPA